MGGCSCVQHASSGLFLDVNDRVIPCVSPSKLWQKKSHHQWWSSYEKGKLLKLRAKANPKGWLVALPTGQVCLALKHAEKWEVQGDPKRSECIMFCCKYGYLYSDGVKVGVSWEQPTELALWRLLSCDFVTFSMSNEKKIPYLMPSPSLRVIKNESNEETNTPNSKSKRTPSKHSKSALNKHTDNLRPSSSGVLQDQDKDYSKCDNRIVLIRSHASRTPGPSADTQYIPGQLLSFTLPEGINQVTTLYFEVVKAVNNLQCRQTTYRMGIPVKTTVFQLGSYQPRAEPYTYLFPKTSVPSGWSVRGSYYQTEEYFDDEGPCCEIIKMNFVISKSS